ncbi:MAG: hypothetical protein K0S85_106 [Pseudomonas orientalis]|nr:hypothetical protein [Pseudomonas orientalis]
MTDLNQPGVISPIERARLSAELLTIRAKLAGDTLAPIEKVRASTRGLAIRAMLGKPTQPGADAGQAAFEKARQFYQENLKGQLITSVIGPVRVNSTGWKKSKHGMKSDPLKARLIEHVREILETGTAGVRQAPHKVRTDGLVAFYFIQKQVTVDDLLVTAGVTVAEDGQGNLFYNVSHEGRDSWQAKESGAPDYAGEGPRSGNAANGMLDSESGAVEFTLADDDLNITILKVVSAGEKVTGVNAASGETAVPATVATQTVEVAGVSVKVPLISKEIEADYNRATHMGKGRDVNAELASDVSLLLGDLASKKHTLDTAEQKAEAAALVEVYARRSAEDMRKDLIAGANNPSWFVTGRSGRNMAKAASASQRQSDRSLEAYRSLQTYRASIATTLYAMRPDEVKKVQAVNANLVRVAEYTGMLAEYTRNKQPTLASESKKWASPKALKLIEQAYQVDPAGTLAGLKLMESQVAELGGMAALFGARSGAGKRIAELLAQATDQRPAEAEEAAPPATVEQGPAPDSSPVPAPGVGTHQIIEYTTKRDKVLRGIIRTDLTLAEAKAIDPYTWRMNGGYFIREKHLAGDTSAIQAAPVPVVLTPEQEAEKQDRDRREALERQQQAISSQVEKLRAAGSKAIASGQQGMNAERNTNTSRRAGMAASAYARAAADEADGKTLNSIADAIEVGAAGPLANLNSRAQLQELKKVLVQAKFESERGLTYTEQQERRGRPFGVEVLQHVTMPPRLVWSSRYKTAAKTLARTAAQGNSKLIAAVSKLGERTERWSLVNDGDIAITRKAYKVLGTVKEQWDLKDPIEMLARIERLNRMGITNDAQLQDACRALLPHLAEKQEESAVVKAERAIIGQKVGIDFFPTPAAVAHRMARLARISKGMRVLEPSAGNGNLADAAAAEGAEVDVVEISSQLRDILAAKGYKAVDHDFMTFTPDEPYQAILMNPPFSKRQDAEHIMRAYGMLASGGTLVAIAGEGVFFGSDQKAEQFRAWLDTHSAVVEKLEGGTFQDNALLAQTSANARLIVLHK